LPDKKIVTKIVKKNSVLQLFGLYNHLLLFQIYNIFLKESRNKRGEKTSENRKLTKKLKYFPNVKFLLDLKLQACYI